MDDTPVRQGQAASAEYDEVLEIHGISLPFVRSVITPAIERPIRRGRYEAGERALLASVLRPEDRVLDLGAGLGLVSASAARIAAHVTAVEANPALLPIVEETWRLNGIRTARLLHGVVAGSGGGTVPFYLRADFWASSLDAGPRAHVGMAEVRRIALGELLAEVRPTVLSCDIEGGEIGLFDAVDLSGLRAVVIELHPKVYGEEGAARVRAALARQGLHPVRQEKPSSVALFLRDDSRAWPPADPTILLATCMKDEGPFILEWLAWQKAIGVTDIVVFTNDCTDGTDRLLDRLAAMGELRHLPNPAAVLGSTYFQPAALSFVQAMPEFRRADFFLSLDVDEFLNIRVGDGTLPDLLRAVPEFDVLSICELNHGSNRRESYAPGWVTEQFPGHGTERPGRHRAQAGVKSLVRLTDRIAQVRNHRPDIADGVAPVWLDGSGRETADLHADPARNGLDCRGRYGLASLDHFALRSLESYLVKMFRGDVVVAGKQVSQRYWRLRDRDEARTSDLAPGIARARAVHDRLAADAALMALHDACCAAHADRIRTLRDLPDFAARREWILREAWLA
jgi:FkbM family methyltransferase